MGEFKAAGFRFFGLTGFLLPLNNGIEGTAGFNGFPFVPFYQVVEIGIPQNLVRYFGHQCQHISFYSGFFMNGIGIIEALFRVPEYGIHYRWPFDRLMVISYLLAADQQWLLLYPFVGVFTIVLRYVHYAAVLQQ